MVVKPKGSPLKTWGVLLLLAIFSLSGCVQVPEEDEPPEDENGDDSPSEIDLGLVVQNPVERLVAGDTVTLVVEASGDEADADWAGIHWGTDSGFEESQTADGDDHPLPGEFTVSQWGPAEAGSYLYRAYVQVEGQEFWSDAHELEVVPEVEEGEIDPDHEIIIGDSSLLGGCDPNAPYDPDPIEIGVGEAVRWTNEDGCGHTATHAADDPQFDTGNIGQDASSHSVRFNKAGTYEYYCAFHAGMSGEIVVG